MTLGMGMAAGTLTTLFFHHDTARPANQQKPAINSYARLDADNAIAPSGSGHTVKRSVAKSESKEAMEELPEDWTSIWGLHPISGPDFEAGSTGSHDWWRPTAARAFMGKPRNPATPNATVIGFNRGGGPSFANPGSGGGSGSDSDDPGSGGTPGGGVTTTQLATPIPPSVLLLGSGILGLAGIRIRSRKRNG